MALNVQMYSPKLPMHGGSGPFIQTGAPTTAAGIAGLIAAGLGGWQAGKEEKRKQLMEQQAVGLKEALTEAQIGTEKARTGYYGRMPGTKTLDPRVRMDQIQKSIQALYKPVFQDPKDPIMAVGAVDVRTGKALTPKIQAYYDGLLREFDALQAQVEGAGGTLTVPTPGLGGAIESSNRRTGERIVGGVPTGQIRPEFPGPVAPGLAGALTGSMPRPVAAPTPAPARVPQAPQVPQGPAQPQTVTIGQEVIQNGKKYRITGVDADGTAIGEEIP
jgi:hypothetical protein